MVRLSDLEIAQYYWQNVLKNFISIEAFQEMNPKVFIPIWVRDEFKKPKEERLSAN
jgi:hypothetical protein